MPEIVTGIKQIAIEDGSTLTIDYDKKLGEGAFGAVYSATYHSADGKITDNNAAVKIPNSDNKASSLDKETQMNLIQGILYKEFKVDGQVYIVMPNLGKPLQNILDPGENLGLTFVEEEEEEEEEEVENLIKPAVVAPKGPANKEKTAVTLADDDGPMNTRVSINIDKDNAEKPEPAVAAPKAKTFVDQSMGTVISINTDDKIKPEPAVAAPKAKAYVDQSMGTVISINKDDDDTLKENPNSESHAIAPAEPPIQNNDIIKGIPPISPDQLAKLRKEGEAAKASKEEGILNIQRERKELDFDDSNFNLDFMHTLKMFDKMAAAVEEAHNNGILHLDIKGENFLYNKQTDTVKLIDYGVSHFIKDAANRKVLGTPNFMAPELMMLAPKGKLSTEQDIYSLGRAYTLTIVTQMMMINKDCISKVLPVHPSYLDPAVRRGVAVYFNLNNFQFKNPDNSADIKAINSLVTIINEMTSLNPDKRPSLAEVRRQLNQITTELKQHQEIMINYEKVLSAIPFQGNNLVDRFLAHSAINAYNQRQEQIWQTQPSESRGDRPLALPIPDNQKLQEMINIIYQDQQEQKAQAKQKGSPDKVTPPSPAPIQPEARVLSDKPPEPVVNDIQKPAITTNPMERLMALNNMVSQPEHDVAELALNIGSKNSSSQLPLSTQPQAQPQPPLQNLNTSTVNKLITSITEDVKNYRDKSEIQANKQRASLFMPFKILVQGDKLASSSDSAQLIARLNNLATASISPSDKLEQLKLLLEKTLMIHQENNSHRLSKGKNSELHQICKTNIDKISVMKRIGDFPETKVSPRQK